MLPGSGKKSYPDLNVCVKISPSDWLEEFCLSLQLIPVGLRFPICVMNGIPADVNQRLSHGPLHSCLGLPLGELEPRLSMISVACSDQTRLSEFFHTLFLFHKKLLISSSFLLCLIPIWGPGPRGKVFKRVA